MGDLDCLLEEWGFGASCGIYADRSKAAFHALAPSEGAEPAGVMEGFWVLWSWVCLVFGTERQIHLHYSVSRWLLLQLEQFVEKSLLRVEISGHPEAEAASENRGQNVC